MQVREGECVLVWWYCGGLFCEVPRRLRYGATDCDSPPAACGELRNYTPDMWNGDVFWGGGIADRYNGGIIPIPDDILADGRMRA